jgi:large conductance mechanosensitive channel
MWNEFKKFLERGSVIELAVAVILGAAFGAIVTSLVNDLIMPLIGILMGGISFTGLVLQVGSAQLKYGNFLQTLVNFLIIASALFLVVRAYNHLRAPKPAPVAPPPAPLPQDVVLLSEIRDLLKERNLN